MRRTIVEVLCDRCGAMQRFELTSNYGGQLVATTNIGEMLDRHQWETRRVEHASELLAQDICRACNGSMFH